MAGKSYKIMSSDERKQAYRRNRKYIKKNKEEAARWKRNSHLQKKYGISLDEYNQRVQQQNGKCAICMKHTNKLGVDHNHITGLVRDLLCHKCNIGIAMFYEDTNILLSAKDYLEKWS